MLVYMRSTHTNICVVVHYRFIKVHICFILVYMYLNRSFYYHTIQTYIHTYSRISFYPSIFYAAPEEPKARQWPHSCGHATRHVGLTRNPLAFRAHGSRTIVDREVRV